MASGPTAAAASINSSNKFDFIGWIADAAQELKKYYNCKWRQNIVNKPIHTTPLEAGQLLSTRSIFINPWSPTNNPLQNQTDKLKI